MGFFFRIWIGGVSLLALAGVVWGTWFIELPLAYNSQLCVHFTGVPIIERKPGARLPFYIPGSSCTGAPYNAVVTCP